MIDALGHPITAGCTVLTSGYWSSTFDTVIKVKRITANYVIIEMTASLYDYARREAYTGVKEVRRKPHQMVVIDKQLKYNRKTHPEFII